MMASRSQRERQAGLSAAKKRAGIATAKNAEMRLPDDATVLDMMDAPDEFKLSAKLINLMSPWVKKIDIPLLANCACAAWNTAISGAEDLTGIDFLNARAIQELSAHKDVIEQLKRRKNKLYPNDFRTIVSMTVPRDASGEFSIVVASTVKPENMSKMIAGMTSAKKNKHSLFRQLLLAIRARQAKV